MGLFSGQDSKGKSIPVKSSDIEQKYQSNPTGSFTFNVGSDSLEIKFKGEKYSHNVHCLGSAQLLLISSFLFVFY